VSVRIGHGRAEERGERDAGDGARVHEVSVFPQGRDCGVERLFRFNGAREGGVLRLKLA
jgi:hypothetical protein